MAFVLPLAFFGGGVGGHAAVGLRCDNCSCSSAVHPALLDCLFPFSFRGVIFFREDRETSIIYELFDNSNEPIDNRSVSRPVWGMAGVHASSYWWLRHWNNQPKQHLENYEIKEGIENDLKGLSRMGEDEKGRALNQRQQVDNGKLGCDKSDFCPSF